MKLKLRINECYFFGSFFFGDFVLKTYESFKENLEDEVFFI